ncbi:MAG: 3-oxoacyl-ACP reductase [Pseudonocardia sp. SCN 72-86]|nr:MAG: 3-oxoacyl-ACP reductase [Pseudonocardia sp. SCN 72-86]
MVTRTALVGGGASGIGFATAQALVRNGFRVVIAGRNAERLDKAAAALEVGTHVADLSDVDATADTLGEVERRWGALDVLVLNAGGPPPGRILDVDDAGWRTAFDLLVLGPLRWAGHVLPGMAERGFGRVVLVTSTAVRQPEPDLAASVVLRSAATAAAKLLAREHAAHGVTVNCVAPGPTATERRRAILENRARATGTDADAADVAKVPAGRAGDACEIAAAVAFLASDAASYVNGTVLTVDGGRTETI